MRKRGACMVMIEKILGIVEELYQGSLPNELVTGLILLTISGIGTTIFFIIKTLLRYFSRPNFLLQIMAICFSEMRKNSVPLLSTT